MKIIFCLHHFLPGHIAGTEVYTLNLVKELQKRGFETAVLIPHFGSAITDEYEYEGIRVIRYAENSLDDRGMILGNKKPEGLATFASILAEERPDIVHFHELIAGRGISIFHVEAAFQLKLRIVLTLHLSYYSCQTGTLVYKSKTLCDGEIKIGKCTDCTYEYKGLTGIKALLPKVASRLLHSAGVNSLKLNSTTGTALGIPFLIDKKKKELQYLFLMCDKIVSLTNFYTSVLIRNQVPKEKLSIITQGIPDLELYKRKKLSVTKVPIKVVFIGRISELKGVHLLLKAIKAISSEKILLDIYGADADEAYAASCRRLSSSLLNVKWKGPIGHEEKIKLLPGYDLLCLPSTFSEMSPLVIQEAFAAGIPVLASNVYGNAEQVTDGMNGWLFNFKNSLHLKERLEMLINDPALIGRAKNHLPPVKPFSEAAAQYVDTYHNVLKLNTKKNQNAG